MPIHESEMPGVKRKISRVPGKTVVVHRYAGKRIRGTIHKGDALAFLRSLKSESAGIVFLDPPFNLGKEYSDRNKELDRRPEKRYEEWLLSILDESVRVLMPGGALYLYHMPIWAMKFGAYLATNLTFRHWIAISMKSGFVRRSRLYPAHYALLYFTKGSPLRFHRPKIPAATCRHCGKKIKDYGGYREIIDRNNGVNLSDFWEDLSPVRHAKYKHRKANELPPKILERIVAISGKRGTLYVDPFAGTGSGVLAAAKAGMEFSACDLVNANCALICRLLENMRNTHR
jgi:site-specific DNA-methyltransferase (adenine-specific)